MDKRNKIQTLCEYLSDAAVLFLSTAITYLLFGIIVKKIPSYDKSEWIQYIVLLILSYTVTFLGFAHSLDLSKQNRTREFLSVLRNCSLTFVAFATILLLIKSRMINSRFLYASSFVLFVSISAAGRYILKRLLIRSFSASKMATLVSIVTTSDRAPEFVKAIKEDWSKKITGITLLDSYLENGHFVCSSESFQQAGGKIATQTITENTVIDFVDDIPVVADRDSFIDIIRTSSIDEVYINLPYNIPEEFNEYIEEIENMGITVHINLPILENIVYSSQFNNIKCDVISGYPIASFSAATHNSTHLFIKRVTDIFGALVGIIFSIPIVALVAIPLLIESPGGLFFKQPRIGRNGRVFNMYKLRSMYKDADSQKKELDSDNTMSGLMFKMDDDPRVTKVGRFIRKTSIDELPQFINVLNGDMSLVGTRPPTIDEFDQYQSHHKRRLSMRPGMTGNWQVSGRSDVHDFEDVVRLDCDYIDNWTPLLDVKILFKTIPAVLHHHGAK